VKAIVVGSGEVGFHIADRLSREGHDVTVIEKDAERERELRDKLNARIVLGNGASPEVLEKAEAAEADLFIAVTDLDEVNIIACLLLSELAPDGGGPRRLARVKSVEYEREDGKLNARKLGIDKLINPQATVGDEICNLVAYGAATGVAEFAGGRVVVLGYPLGEESPLAGVSLRELGEIRGAMYPLVVTALARESETLIPRGDDVLQPGDTVYFACRRRELPAVRYLFGFENEDSARRVFILGGGRIGRRVARKLAEDKRYRITVVEADTAACEELARDIAGVRVINTDGTDIETLREEGLDKADVVVAVTPDDKTNILCSLLAKKAGAERAIALVDQPEFVTLAPSLGVDACLSARLATAAAILKHVRGGMVETLSILGSGDAEVLELIVPEDNAHLDRPLKTLRLPDDSIIASIVRGDDAIVPSGDDTLMADDHVVLFALPKAVSKVQRFFGGNRRAP
jgi:trk system potassium uptake protein TrkA